MKQKTETMLLWTLGILSLVTISLVKFIFNDVQEYWKHGSEIGEILYDLSLATIASIIFYWIVVVIPQNRNRRNIYEHVGSITDVIIYHGSGILDGLSSRRDFQKIDVDMTYEEFIQLCQAVGPNSLQDYFSTQTKQYAITYNQHIIETIKRLKDETRSLLTYMPHLDTEHIRLVNAITRSQLMKYEGYFSEFNQPTFESVSNVLYDFYRKVRDLRAYLGKESVFHKISNR